MPGPDFLKLLARLEIKNDWPTMREAVRARGRVDLEFFARYFFAHFCKHPFNDFHYEIIDTFKPGARGTRIARAAPRGYAKSTFKALIIPVHDVCYGNENFIIMLSESMPLSREKLRDIRSEVLTNDLLFEYYGVRFPTKKPADSHFTIITDEHTCRYMAFGRGSQVRGIRYGEHRPTKVICDDVEDSEEVENEEIRGKDKAWFFEDVSNIGDENTNIDFIGTVLHIDSLLSNLLQNPAYDGKIYQAIDKWSGRQDLWNAWEALYINLDRPDRMIEAENFFAEHKENMLAGTKVLWPEKEPYLWLMKERIEKGHRAFMKEKQNQPLGSDDSVFERIHWYHEVPEGIYVEESRTTYTWAQLSDALGAMDPATGQNKVRKGRKGDYTCILTGYTDPLGRLLVHRDRMRREPPTKYIGQIFEHNEKFKYNKFGIETNLYRNLLLPNILQEQKERNKFRQDKIDIKFIDIVNTENKEKRIYALEPKVTYGWILFNRSLGKEFVNQLLAFPKGDHDDGPDTLEMLWKMAFKPSRAGAVNTDPMGSR